jgi:hypothetical protein
MVNFRKLIIICILIFCCKGLFAQDAIPEPSQWTQAPYRLFRTRNMWAFIQLDTITGKLWQVHFDVGGDNRAVIVLDIQDRASGKERIPGRFTLYPTSNMYAFILHDQIDGITWQVQWSNERRNRLVIRISE